MSAVHHQIELGEAIRNAILATIKETPLTLAGLCEALDMRQPGIRKHIATLKRQKPRCIYVADFKIIRGKGAPIYAYGNFPDAVFVSTPHVKPSARRAKEVPPVAPIRPQSWLAALGL